MTRTSLLLALVVLTALPLFGQSTEFGMTIGGSRRFVEEAPTFVGEELLGSDFSLKNGSFDLYWALQMDDYWFKMRGGRIESPVAFLAGETEEGGPIRRDLEGEVQHLEGVVEYRFSEPFGSTGLFGGIGAYRHTAPSANATVDWGFVGGVNADFPLSRRYGVVVEGAYHWTQAEFRPRYMTIGAGLRIAF